MKHISFDTEINITHIATTGAVFAYTVGYLVHSLYARSIGIQYLPFVKAEYIEVGLVFTILSFLLIAVPVALWTVITGTKQHFQYAPTGSKRSLVTALNFCLVLMLFALFITKTEWDAASMRTVLCDMSFQSVFHIYLWFTLLGLIAVGELQKLEHSLAKSWVWPHLAAHPKAEYGVKKSFDLLAGGVRWLLVAAAILFDTLLVRQMPWILSLFTHMRYYIPMLMLVAYSGYRVKCRMRELHGNDKLRTRLAVVFAIVLVPLVYVTIISYTFGPYSLLPDNRGGKLPLRYARLHLSIDARKSCGDILDVTSTNDVVTVPLRICDQTEDMYFVTEWPHDPLKQDMVLGVARSLVLSVASHPTDRSFRTKPKGADCPGDPRTVQPDGQL